MNWGVVDADVVVLVALELEPNAKGLCAVSFSGLGDVKENGPGAWLAEVVCSDANGDETEAKGLGAVDGGAVAALPMLLLPLNNEENGLLGSGARKAGACPGCPAGGAFPNCANPF